MNRACCTSHQQTANTERQQHCFMLTYVSACKMRKRRNTALFSRVVKLLWYPGNPVFLHSRKWSHVPHHRTTNFEIDLPTLTEENISHNRSLHSKLPSRWENDGKKWDSDLIPHTVTSYVRVLAQVSQNKGYSHKHFKTKKTDWMISEKPHPVLRT